MFFFQSQCQWKIFVNSNVSRNHFFLGNPIWLGQCPHSLSNGKCTVCPKICPDLQWSLTLMSSLFHSCLVLSLPPIAYPLPSLWVSSRTPLLLGIGVLADFAWQELGRVSVQWSPNQGYWFFVEPSSPVLRLTLPSYSPWFSSPLFLPPNLHLFPACGSPVSLCFPFSCQGSPSIYVGSKMATD